MKKTTLTFLTLNLLLILVLIGVWVGNAIDRAYVKGYNADKYSAEMLEGDVAR